MSLTGVSVPGGTGLSNESRILGGTLTLVNLPRQEGELFASPWGTARRHARVLIPVEGTLNAAEKLGVVKMTTEALPGCRTAQAHTTLHRPPPSQMHRAIATAAPSPKAGAHHTNLHHWGWQRVQPFWRQLFQALTAA